MRLRTSLLMLSCLVVSCIPGAVALSSALPDPTGDMDPTASGPTGAPAGPADVPGCAPSVALPAAPSVALETDAADDLATAIQTDLSLEAGATLAPPAPPLPADTPTTDLSATDLPTTDLPTLCVAARAEVEAGVDTDTGPTPASADDAAAPPAGPTREQRAAWTQEVRERALLAVLIASVVGLSSAFLQGVVRLARGVRPLLAFFPTLVPLFSRIEQEEVLDNPVRARLHAIVVQQPGISLQDLRTEAGVAWGTAVHHVQRLERHGKLVSLREGNHRRCFPADPGAAVLRRHIAALAQPTARRVALCVGRRPGIDQKTLCEELGLRNPAASKHLARLAGHGLVEVEADGRSRRYTPTPALHEALARMAAPPPRVVVRRTRRIEVTGTAP